MNQFHTCASICTPPFSQNYRLSHYVFHTDTHRVFDAAIHLTIVVRSGLHVQLGVPAGWRGAQRGVCSPAKQNRAQVRDGRQSPGESASVLACVRRQRSAKGGVQYLMAFFFVAECVFICGVFLLQVIHADVCTQEALLRNADVVVMNNVFEYFMEPGEQVRSGQDCAAQYGQAQLKDMQLTQPHRSGPGGSSCKHSGNQVLCW